MDVIMGNVSQDLGMTYGCYPQLWLLAGQQPAEPLYHARNLDNISMMDWAQVRLCGGL